MADLLDKLHLTNDQKKQFNKFKHDLESYREIILIINSILKWEKNFYPGILFGSVSIGFLFLWFLDLSILTFFSLLLLLVNIVGYFYPIVSKILFKSENWNGEKENKFEEVCHEIMNVKASCLSGYNTFSPASEEKSTVFVVIVSAFLLLLAWIGASIDNLFLSYLMTLFIVFYPGLAHNGIVDKFKKQMFDIFGSLMNNFMPNSKKNK